MLAWDRFVGIKWSNIYINDQVVCMALSRELANANIMYLMSTHHVFFFYLIFKSVPTKCQAHRRLAPAVPNPCHLWNPVHHSGTYKLCKLSYLITSIHPLSASMEWRSHLTQNHPAHCLSFSSHSANAFLLPVFCQFPGDLSDRVREAGRTAVLKVGILPLGIRDLSCQIYHSLSPKQLSLEAH